MGTFKLIRSNIWSLLLLTIAAALLGGCGTEGSNSGLATLAAAAPVTVENPAFPSLDWPPADGPARSASDDEIELPAAEYDAAGGNVVVEDTAIRLTGKSPLSWATYSCDGFGPFVAFSSLKIQYVLEPAQASDEISLYYGLANYTKGRWDWFQGTPGNFAVDIENQHNYISPSGQAHVALVNWGQGSCRANKVSFVRVGATSTGTPQNLRAEAFVGEIHLEWDPVVPCLGYNVYRAADPLFSDPVKLNSTLVTSTSYVNEATTHRIWYYKVTAMLAFESEMSNMVDIFCPRVDRPTPLNLRATGKTLTSVTLEWEWPEEEEEPYMWRIYYKGDKDFNLFEPIESRNAPPFSRQTTLEGLIPGETVHFRIASMRSDGDMGRMTDDVPGAARNLYNWGDIEVIGPGTHPLDVIVAEDDLTATYVQNYEFYIDELTGSHVFVGGHVRAARRDEGEWTVDPISEPLMMLVEPYDIEYFFDCIDIAYSEDEYMIGAFTMGSNDVWTFEGMPGDAWTGHRLAGDGVTGPLHPVEGLGLRVASDGEEYSASFLDYTSEELLLFRKGVDEADTEWERTLLRNENVDIYLNYHSMDYNGAGELSVMTLDLLTGKLLVGSEVDNFEFESVLPDEITYVGAFNDLHFIDDHWFASAFDGPEHRLVLVNDGSQPWEIEPVSYRDIEAGNHSRLSSFQGHPMVLYYGTPPEEYLGHQQRWYFGLYENGNWHTEWIQIENYEYYAFGPEAEICDLNGQLYFIFEDQYDGKIKAARATPPEL